MVSVITAKKQIAQLKVEYKDMNYFPQQNGSFRACWLTSPHKSSRTQIPSIFLFHQVHQIILLMRVFVDPRWLQDFQALYQK